MGCRPEDRPAAWFADLPPIEHRPPAHPQPPRHLRRAPLERVRVDEPGVDLRLPQPAREGEQAPVECLSPSR